MRVVGIRLALGGLALALALTPGVASAAKTWKLRPQSKYGLIAVQIPPPGDLFVLGGDYELQFMAYDPQQRKFKTTLSPRLADINLFTGLAEINVFSFAPYERFHLRNAEPGVYALRSMMMSDWWGTCFSAGTYYFEVKPGVTTYVGAFDPRRNVGEVEDAVRTGRLPHVERNREPFFVFNMPRPALTLPADDPKALADLTTWLRSEQPGVQGDPVAADMIPTTFANRPGDRSRNYGDCGTWEKAG
jgi:hypothetical protein